MRTLRLEKQVNQNPDAIITSRNSWLARLDAAVAATRSAGRPRTPPVPPAPPPLTLRTVVRTMTASLLAGDLAQGTHMLQRAVDGGVAGAGDLAEALRRMGAGFEPERIESACGIKVRGARISSVFLPSASNTGPASDGRLVEVDTLDDPGASALVRVDTGTACVIPVFQGFLSGLTFDQGELVDVSFEPSAGTPRWAAFGRSASRIRALRALFGAASRLGRFSLAPDDLHAAFRHRRDGQDIDPTLALYAAYPSHDLQYLQPIQDISTRLRADLGVTLFDLELLGGQLARQVVDRRLPILPCVPLLSPGWSLLRAHRVTLHPALDGIESRMRGALWTQFDPDGARQIERALASQGVR